MILTPHVTRCPACRLFVYAQDDIFSTPPWPGTEDWSGTLNALYHYDCFRKLPDAGEYLDTAEQAKNAVLDVEDDYFTVLLRTPKFAVALRTMTNTFQLFFLAEGRQFDFRDVAHWQLFLKCFATVREPQATLPSGDAGTRITKVAEGWQIARRSEVPIECDMSLNEFEVIQANLRQRGINPAAVPVNLGAMMREHRILPTRVSCPLDRLIGRYTLTNGESDGSTPLTLTVQVEKWDTVVLSQATAVEFCQFARQLYQHPKS